MVICINILEELPLLLVIAAIRMHDTNIERESLIIHREPFYDGISDILDRLVTLFAAYIAG